MENNYNNIYDKELRNFKNICSLEQMSVINYAIYRPEISIEDLKLMISCGVPVDYMRMYINMIIIGIDVTKYVKNNWKLMEILVDDLESAILSEHGITREEAKVLRRKK